MKPHIAIIGSCVCDVVVEIPHLPATGEDVNIIKQSLSLGGCAYNVANILECSKTPYILFAPIGTGIYGDFVKNELHQQNMFSLLENINEESGCCYCMVEKSGERTFISNHGAEYRFQEEWFAILDQYPIDTVYICGLEIEEETGIHIIHYLQKHPNITIYFAPGPRICEIEEIKMKNLFELSCILHINKQEALEYSQKSNINEAARSLYKNTHAPVIITLGDEGSYCFDGTNEYFASTKKRIPVDTIGAGDGHIGSVLLSRYQKYNWLQTLQFANNISSAIISKKGSGLDKETFLKITQKTTSL